MSEKLTLPRNAGAVWCELDVQPSLLGRLVGFFYQTPALYLKAYGADGSQPRDYRLVPGMAKAGFLLTPLIADDRDFIRVQTGHMKDEQRISAFSVAGEEGSTWFLRSKVKYRLYEVPPFTPPPSPAVR